jgi:hypothetical protein
VLGNVIATIDALKQPHLFVRLMQNGHANVLEGAAIDDSTVGIDLPALRFESGRPRSAIFNRLLAHRGEWFLRSAGYRFL